DIYKDAHKDAYAHALLCIASPRAPAAQQNVLCAEMPQEFWLSSANSFSDPRLNTPCLLVATRSRAEMFGEFQALRLVI
ncbi:MAG: hypothetical protein ACLQFW_12295, partial [Xanthobacteraceae bacterium]